MEYLKAFLLAVVEGVTEFLPISSTGHLILLEDFLQFSARPEFTKAFMVVIQLPAIVAVVLYFWRDLWPFDREMRQRPEVFWLWGLTAIGFLPAAVLGLLLDDFIALRLFNPLTVAIALIVGGLLLIIIERRNYVERYATVHDLRWPVALAIGCFQCLAMIPGTSRSASTIIGGLLMGASRPAAAEFSFFLAIPTMLGATTLKMYKYGFGFSREEWLLLILGSVVSFVTAYLVIAALMQYIRKHTFTVFGYYRIVVGLIVLSLLWL